MDDGLETRIERLVAEEARFDVRRSRVGADLLIAIELTGPHLLTLRVQEGGVLLDVDNSQALEFAASDDEDMADLEQVLRAYCRGELEAAASVDGRSLR